MACRPAPTTPARAPTGSRSLPDLSGLAAGTTYHYRLVAQNSAGTSQGADQTFTTSLAKAPVATTGAAGQIGPRDATVNGTVNPNGTSTTYWFQYGTTMSYGLQTGIHNAGSGTSDRRVSGHLSGLAAGTTYHYRLVAQNAAGTTRGADQTFATSAASAPTVSTGRAFGVGKRSAFVSGTVDAKGTPTTYWFQYGTSTSYGLQTRTHTIGPWTRSRHVFVFLSALAPGTTYHYRLIASNGTVTTNGADQTFTTRPSKTQPHRHWSHGTRVERRH